jgi:hypothetical protein
VIDARPPDTEGLNYRGQDCTRGEHASCPGYWAADPEITGKWGRGTRCVCDCHDALEGATEEVTPNETP